MLYIGELIFLAFGYTISLLIFQQGLLLKRHVLTTRSQCTDVITYNSTICWLKPQYKKAILLVVDVEDLKKISETEKYFRGHLSFVNKLLINSKNNTRLFPFIADAPTTTFQRIKAFTTGTIPAFIEAGDNFGGANVYDDNIIDQFVNKGKNVTLVQLLPERYNRQFVLPSFDIYDLDLVDNLIIDKIYKEIKREEWSLLIAHTLGIDHCGHRYSPSHPEMKRKLLQLDHLIKNIINILENDTILFVMGDHGMTANGDHGGDSIPEITSALFVYSKKPFEKHLKTSTINQIDLVPTISILLDIPIPFSNLGIVIEDLISHTQIDLAMKLNAIQILRYAQQYNIIRDFENSNNNDVNMSRTTIHKTQNLLRQNLNRFNLGLAFIGLLSLAETLIYNIAILINYKLNYAQWIFRSALLFLQFSLYFNSNNTDVFVFLFITLLASILYFTIIFVVNLYSFSIKKNSFSILSKMFIIVLAFSHGFSYFSNSYIIYESSVVRTLLQLFLFLNLITHYTLISDPKKYGLKNFVSSKISYTTLICMLAIRFTKNYEICREEHVLCQPNISTKSTLSLNQNDSERENILLREMGFGILCLIIMNVFVFKTLTNYIKSQKFANSTTKICTHLLLYPMVGGVIMHWICETVSNQHSNFSYGSLISAQFVYMIFFLHLLFAIILSNNLEEMWLAHSLMLFNVLAMILGHGLAPSFLLLVICCILGRELIQSDSILMPFFFTFLSQTAFYALAHQATFTSIPWQAAFVGIPGNFWFKPLTAFLVLCHIYAGNIVTIYNLIYGIITDKNENNVKIYLTFVVFNVIRVNDNYFNILVFRYLAVAQQDYIINGT